MKKYRLAVFDLDGTLIDTSPGIIQCLKAALTEMNYEIPPMSQLMKFIGPPLGECFSEIIGIPENQIDEAIRIFRKGYTEEGIFNAIPYNNIMDILKELQQNGIKTAVATYKKENLAVKLLEHFTLSDNLNVIHGADDKVTLTKQDIIKLCITECGITDLSEVVMIGDSVYDAVGAENVGVDFIGVTYGMGFKSCEDILQHKNIGCADTVSEILKFII